MAIPFLHLFKRKSAKTATAPAAAPRPFVEKPSSERLSKTVMPSASRAAHSTEPQHALSAGHETVATNGSTAVAVAPAAVVAPKPVPFALTAEAPAAASPAVPPAVAMAPSPAAERAISIELGELAEHLPAGTIRPLQEGEADRVILLKAAELERGMANGKPAVSLTSIHQQVPELFVEPVGPSDETQVPLPFAKVLEQFANLQVRMDQQRAVAVPQVETPFLQVTLEDGERFGTPVEKPETQVLPPMRVQPATAETIAAAEPEALPAATVPATPASTVPRRITVPMASSGSAREKGQIPARTGTNGHGAHTAEPAGANGAGTPARIPFKISTNGTGGSPEKVPASSGPSVPVSGSETGAAAPARIPFKLSVAPAESAPSTNGAGTEKKPVPFKLGIPSPAENARSQTMISLALRPIFAALPPVQFVGDAQEIAEDAVVELPFALVEPQLVTGKVAVQPKEFAAALPEPYRGMFITEADDTPVSLPLQEVLKNLPAASLQMRTDQVEQEARTYFATPFSTTAEEDAKRFNIEAAPVPRSTPAVAPEDAARAPGDNKLRIVVKPESPRETSEASGEAPEAPKPRPADRNEAVAAKAGKRTPLQVAFDTDDELDARAVVARISALPGVKACAIVFSDGLALAGDMPESSGAEGICAMAPSMLQRVQNHMVETRLGEIHAMTLFCTEAAITFLMHDNLCLGALHSGESIDPETRTRLSEVVRGLSCQFSHPA